MQTATAAMPMPETPSVSSIWIRNNVIFALIGVTIGFVLFGTDKLFGIGTSGTSTALRMMGAGVNGLAMIATFGVYAMLTGIALAQKLPGFPQRMWTMLHVAMGAIFGVGVGAAVFYADPSAAVPVQTPVFNNTVVAISASLLAIGVGAVVGVIAGGIQTLVLRRVATQVMPWIGLSAAATAAMIAMLLISMAIGFVTLGETFGNIVALEVVVFAATVVFAFIMLPAVNRLTPRVPRG